MFKNLTLQKLLFIEKKNRSVKQVLQPLHTISPDSNISPISQPLDNSPDSNIYWIKSKLLGDQLWAPVTNFFSCFKKSRDSFAVCALAPYGKKSIHALQSFSFQESFFLKNTLHGLHLSVWFNKKPKFASSYVLHGRRNHYLLSNCC